MPDAHDPPTEPQPPSSELAGLPPYLSPTLARIPAKQRPERSTLCEACPGSLWFASEKGLQAFCRVMHVIVWSNEEPNALTECDGQVLAEIERQEKFYGKS